MMQYSKKKIVCQSYYENINNWYKNPSENGLKVNIQMKTYSNETDC